MSQEAQFKETQSEETNSKGTLKIHSENILPILKKWLYSDKDIFARELVSNACDAIQKVKILRDRGEAQELAGDLSEVLDQEFKIEIRVDKEAKTLTFSDTGIGMDVDEVERYIAQLAFSGASEFLEKYRSNDEKDQIIGHFGLGFYSAYMVAEKVEINTLSYKKKAKAVLWSCDGISEYTLEKGTREKRGTEITLFLSADAEEYLDVARLSEILNQYCSFLPFPIYLNDRLINEKVPLWIKPASECTEKEYLDFYRQLYPGEEEPLFWIHLNVDYPFHLKGILYFPRLRQNIEFNKNNIKLFCNRVFVSDNCKDLMPEYLMVLRGAIDSPDIPLNVSRSYLQMDRTVRQLAVHIAKKVSDRLSGLYKTEHERFLTCWSDVEVVVKLGAIQDDKFYERVKEFLIWKNTQGEWTTLEEYLTRNEVRHKDKVYYTTDERNRSPILEVYKQKGVEVLFTNGPIDAHLIPFLEQKHSQVKFQRIDAAVSDDILDAEGEKSVLDAEGKTEATRLADLMRQMLALDKVDVEAKSLSSTSLPALLVLDEHARRFRDYLMMTKQGSTRNEAGAEMMQGMKRTFIVNTNSKLIRAIEKMHHSKPELAKDLLYHTYEMTLLSQRELDPKSLDAYISRNHQVLEQLASLQLE
jgi:molecular chaperone HtpG